MAHLIDKSALVAEIEKWIELLTNEKSQEGVSQIDKLSLGGRIAGLQELIVFIDTLEVKEVNNVWHDASETPKGAGDKEILVQFSDSHASVHEVDDWEYLDNQTKWAYLKDLT